MLWRWNMVGRTSAPGIRANYNANYYGAFVRDRDGNKIEAVTYTARECFDALP
jgi:hypothetical protein